MPVDAGQLLHDLKRQVGKLEDDLRERAGTVAEIREKLESEYQQGREAGRIGDAFEAWREGILTQAAVHWALGGVFVRFLEDNGLIDPMLAGPGERGRMAGDHYTHYFQQPDHRTHSDRDYLQHAFRHVADLPTGERLFDPAHNPVWTYTISADAARDLLAFWRRVDPDTGRLAHDFTDPDWDTRFLGDLYQDLSDWAKKTYALLQTPDFVEAFILDRTLEPAIREFGLAEVKMIDPTCGSGHFLLGGFHRLLDRWRRQEPATNERALVQRALDAVYGVDLNPFAVAIARFRLLAAALKASGVTRLAKAPDFQLHVATGDSLLHGARKGQLSLAFGFHMEDAEEANRILSRHYHAVVGNPPYITVKDKALNQRYRELYTTCHRKYALSVPFMERFWELTVPGKNGVPAGFVGQITANSFMKREFGKKLIEDFFPTVDLTHVIDTSGAYIPGHGTPTVIILGLNRAPVGESVRAVMGIKGEPNTPLDPAKGQVWNAIMEQSDQPGSEGEFVSVADSPRGGFHLHPWSLGGGGAGELKETLDAISETTVGALAKSIGFSLILSEDEAFGVEKTRVSTVNMPEPRRALVEGDQVRDWLVEFQTVVVFPYDDQIQFSPSPEIDRYLWSMRSLLWARNTFNKESYRAAGRPFQEYHQIPVERNRTPLGITFASVATHNHFVLDRDGRLFKQSAPVIKLSASAATGDYLAIIGLLNSSTACFWLKQVSHNKGSTVDQKGARQTTDPFENFYDISGTKVGQFPVPDEKPLELATRLDSLAQDRQQHLPDALAEQLPMPRPQWEQHRAEADRLRRQMITLQEELDWRCYRLYGITDDELTYRDASRQPLTPPEINLGERAFEIVLARRMAAGEEDTTWFARHGSTLVTEVPSHWPEDYRRLVERRIERIEEDRYVGLVERPEYKRRWNTEPWDEQAEKALQEWLKSRLEDAPYWPTTALQTTRRLADRAERDEDFMAVAELYRGRPGFEVHALVRELVEEEAVPFLPALRYKPSGLRKREVWERTWELQRQEDAIDAAVERELTRREKETEQQFRERVEKEQKKRKKEEVGDIPRLPKYKSADFANSTYWSLRGKLDVPKERFVSYPFCSKESDPSLLVGWAGWNHLEQALALGAYIQEVTEREGWPPERLVPLLAGVVELIPWLKQWHNEIDPEYSQRMGDFYETYLNGQLHQHGLTREDLKAWEAPAKRRGRKRKGTGST